MFAAEFEPADTAGRRRSPRAPIGLDARFGRYGLGRALCKVVDASLHGARLATYTAVRRGQVLWLTLPRIGNVVVEVMWADDFTAGCQFRTALKQAQLDLLLAQDV